MNERLLIKARELDAGDELRGFRQRFHFPETPDGVDPIYFTGNSLGLMPKKARDYVAEELDDWARFAVEGHLTARHPWLPYHELVTHEVASIVGALPAEVVVMNSLTVNLHLLLVSFYRPTTDRFKIVIEKGAFPSDRYALESQIKFHGYDPSVALMEIGPRENETTLRTEDILEVIESHGDTIALIMFGGVNYYTGQAFDMAAIAEAGREAGAVVGYDLAHAAGNIELKLHDWDVDFAAWCSYKYLNAGPGAVAGVFVHERHAESFGLPRFAGWWGHDKGSRFRMGPDFKPLPGAEGWQISNPPILQMAALRASLEIFAETGMDRLIAKSKALTSFLAEELRDLAGSSLSIITPEDPAQRGCQLSIRVGNKELHRAMSARGVFTDWREPDVIRAAPVPLYNSFEDAARFALILKECLKFA